jgi:hypothetical protein
MKKNSFFLNLCFFLCALNSFGQFDFNFQDSIVVMKSGSPLKMPWTGGLNYVQISDIDVDFDGDLDLFVFDRSTDQIRIFTQEQEGATKFYKYSPLGFLHFPTDLRYRATTIDYNQDGKNDIFTYGIGGVKVYKNVGNAINGLQWELVSSLLYSDYNGSYLNLYVSSSDIPAIVDVEGDGDLDFLTYHIGGEHLQYHQNQSQELYGHSDSLIFVLKNECWGGYREDLNSNSVFLNDPNAPCAVGNVPNAQKGKNDEVKAHAGSTVLALDIDGSGVKDLIVGDVSYSNLNLLINGGTTPNSNSLIVSANPDFPSNSTPISMQVFPAAFWVDVDFDGMKDLMVTPNAKNASENEASVMKYKNTANNSTCNFVYETRAFLQQDMIDHGTASVPVLADINNDGLQDLFVSNYYSYKPTLSKQSRIAYYKNTGTATNPKFTYVDNDFLGLSQTNYGLKMTPSFGDLDGDGKKDLLLGLENGTLVYYKNTSVGSSLTFANPVLDFQDNLGQIISVGQFAAPQLFDLNKDSKLDLIIGEKTGKMLYYKNIGSISAPQFQLENDNLGGIDVATTTPDGFPIPHFISNNDTTYLLLGSYDGAIRFYDSIDDNLASGSLFNLRSSNFLGLQKEIGTFSACAVSDLDNDGKLNLFIGQDLGGLYHLEHLEGSSLGLNDLQEDDFKIYPNPFSNELTIEMNRAGESVSIFDVLGNIVEVRNLEIGINTFNYETISSGIYIVKFKLSGKVKRIVKR